MTNDERMVKQVEEIRDLTIREMIDAARRMEREPNNPDHIAQIQYCVRNYCDAQMILNPRFFGD